MDACLITFLIVIIIFAVCLVLIFTIGRRPKLLCTIPNRDIITYRHEMLNRLKYQNYEIQEKKNDHVFVNKDFFSSTTLVLKQNGPNVEVCFIHSNSNAFLAVFIILFLFVWIAAIILAVIADSKSKSYRENELKPLLMGYSSSVGRMCPTCGRPIPMDARICPYCAKPLA